MHSNVSGIQQTSSATREQQSFNAGQLCFDHSQMVKKNTSANTLLKIGARI